MVSRRLKIIALRLILGIAIISLALALAAYFLFSASLPRRAGSASIDTLTTRVSVELDTHGVPRVTASTILDAFRAQGFLHAQDRFFQMDLNRRSAAGELAALVGVRAVEIDKQRRVVQFRKRAESLYKTLTPEHRAYLDSYADGVNAGLHDLGSRLPEYWLLRQKPQAWLPQDSLLVVYALYTMLSNNDAYEIHNGAMRDVLPQSLFELLTPQTSRFDRPLTARHDNDPSGGYEPLSMPRAGEVDLRATRSIKADIVRQPLAPVGSNNWALSGDRTDSGKAILANDPHLQLRAPNVFYRIEMAWPDNSLRGVSIPGIPGVMIGANNDVAWGATVSYGDQSDYVVIEIDATNPERYLVATGAEPFIIEKETIAIAGGAAPLILDVRSTRWGPIVDADWQGRPLALRATWLEADGLNTSLLDIHAARGAEDAIARLGAWHGPSLNWMVADRHGAVAWTVNGPIPARRGFDGTVPESWANGRHSWSGAIELPAIIAGKDDTLFSANNRQMAAPYSKLFSRVALAPFRANRIAELLAQGQNIDERTSFDIQLDTRVGAYDFLRELALEAIDANGSSADLAALREQLVEWDGFASKTSTAFATLDVFYDTLLEAVLGPLLQTVSAVDSRFIYRWPLADEALRRILDERPPHLLPGQYSHWQSLLADALAQSLELLRDRGIADDTSWGESNRLEVSHPLANIPLLGYLMRFPQIALAGSHASIRVARPGFGAVLRMNVSPAAPERGILQLAGGQSGHFLSPHFDDLLTAWATDEPTPFLAGPAIEQFDLVPGND